jgi:hypothetical protein
MNKYISKYSNGKEVSPAQYITEIVCEKKAKQSNEDLHYRFWLNKKWSSFYKRQIAKAHKLVKEYNPKAIIKALNDPKLARVYSLHSPFLSDSLIKKYEKIIESENQELTKEYNRPKDIKFSKKTGTKNIISRLKDIE